MLRVQDSLSQTPDEVVRFQLNDTQTDAEQILQFLETTKQYYVRSPQIREFTVSLLRGLDNNDQLGQINRVLGFVRRNLVYVRDPIDSEYVVSPVQLITQHLNRKPMAGDCDDHVLLLNTMLGTIGFNTKFVGVKFNGSPIFNHVISGIEIGGQLRLVDPCAKFMPQPDYRETLII